MLCSFPRCKADAAPQLGDLPICGMHARAVYLAVKDRLEWASMAERQEAAARIGGSKPDIYRSTRRGVIYFARFGYLIKIGFTTDLRGRMATLKPDEVLLTVPGTMRDEKAMHERFKRLRERDEFFLPGPELTDYIAERKAA